MSDQLPVFTIAELEELTGLDANEFDSEAAVDLGLIGVEVIRERHANLCVQVVVGDEVAFRANLGTTSSANDEWLAGKAAVARRFSEPSLLVKLRNEAAGTTLVEQGLDETVYRAHGGSIPIRVAGEVVGTITMSGEPDVVDHSAVAETVRRYLTK
jgi:uncharacterized protein (UPF0303 family)